MKLYLMRHGDSLSHANDDLRPLSEKGELEIKWIRDFIQFQQLEVSKIYHSKKRRAQQTAQLIAPAFPKVTALEQREDLDPLADLDPVLIESETWQSDVLLVGHMPFMEKLACELLFKNMNGHLFVFKTGSLLCLEKFGPGVWSTSWFLTPTLFANV